MDNGKIKVGGLYEVRTEERNATGQVVGVYRTRSGTVKYKVKIHGKPIQTYRATGIVREVSLD